MNKFSERFRQLKIELKLSNNRLSSIIGVCVSIIKSWECGLSKPRVSKLHRLCILFDVSAIIC